MFYFHTKIVRKQSNKSLFCFSLCLCLCWYQGTARLGYGQPQPSLEIFGQPALSRSQPLVESVAAFQPSGKSKEYLTQFTSYIEHISLNCTKLSIKQSINHTCIKQTTSKIAIIAFLCLYYLSYHTCSTNINTNDAKKLQHQYFQDSNMFVNH